MKGPEELWDVQNEEMTQAWRTGGGGREASSPLTFTSPRFLSNHVTPPSLVRTHSWATFHYE